MFAPKQIDWDTFFSHLRESLYAEELPSVSKIAKEKRDPFRVLISTMISARTKDEVTLEVSGRLFQQADNPAALAGLSENEIAGLIYPAGFYATKAKHIRETARRLGREFGGTVPNTLEDLISLPGVGRKTANLVLNLGFGIAAICVDTHVHRITNRMGLVTAKTPKETERELQKILPKKYWVEINGLLVSYGKKICTPQSPFCSRCVFEDECPKAGVIRRR